ncbi:MAG: mobile mystery protein A [Acidimicrobiales bacterium]
MARTPARRSAMKRSQDGLTRHLGPLVDTEILVPHAGWIRATRDALGLSASELARRMSVHRSRIGQIEAGEKTGSIRLSTLDRAASAMGCRLVYAIVPEGSYQAVIDRQSEADVAELVSRVLHTMALEGQELSPEAAEELRKRTAEEWR